MEISISGELVLQNSQLLNVLTGEVYEADIIISNGIITGITKRGQGIGKKIVDFTGLFAVPGFIDAHFHTESTLLSLPELTKVLLQRGTTTIFVNPHEIANVLGLKGIKMLLQDAINLPIRIYVIAPCKVPTVPGLEVTGANFGIEEIEEMLSWPEVVGIGEIDAFKLLKPQPKYTAMIELAKSRTLSICGSINGFSGNALSKCLFSGITDDHESISAEEALEKLRLGATVFIREGSTERNLEEIICSVKDKIRFFDKFCFCTDDKHPDELLEEGHIDYCIKKAISLGIEIPLAYRMASFNTASHFKMQHKIGLIAPGRQADIVLLSDLENVAINKVLFNGKIVVDERKIVYSYTKLRENNWGRNTVNVKRPLKVDDVKVAVEDNADYCNVRAAKIVPDQIITKLVSIKLPVSNKQVELDLDQDINKFILVERHNATGKIVKGFIQGFGLKKGAIASSVAHDHHNLIALGVEDEDIVMAINSLITMEGGLVAVCKGKILASLPLPIAGLVSDLSLDEVLQRLLELQVATEELGNTLPQSPFAILSLMTLPVIPEVGFTDQGMIDVYKQKVIDSII
jgi:adenine deaminase